MRLSFVLLPDPKPLTAAVLEKALGEHPELGKLGGFKADKKGSATFKVGKLEFVAALAPVPLPPGEAEEGTDRSLSGLDGTWTLPEHRAHVAVVLQDGKLNDLVALTAYTRVVAAVVRALGACGVYWGAGGVTHHPEFVVNMAQSELPLPVWVGVSVAPTGERFELLSVGMAQLGLPDLLLEAPAVDGETLEFFYDLLAYVARRGKKLPEGDLVGRGEKEKLEVTYVPSPLDAKAKVWRVTLSPPRKRAAKRPTKPKKKK